MEYEIILCNFMKCKTKDGHDIFRVGYLFADEDLFSNNKFVGVSEQQIFINKDLSQELSVDDILSHFSLQGTLESDYTHPLNKRFVPKVLTNLETGNVVSLS